MAVAVANVMSTPANQHNGQERPFALHAACSFFFLFKVHLPSLLPHAGPWAMQSLLLSLRIRMQDGAIGLSFAARKNAR
jgi:hypothetical protein